MADRTSGVVLRASPTYVSSRFLGNTSIDEGVGARYASMPGEIIVTASADVWTADKSLMFRSGDGYPMGVRNRVGLFADGFLPPTGQFTSGTPMGLSDAQIGTAQERLDFINASYYNSPNYHNNALTYGIASVVNWLAGTGAASPVIPGAIGAEYDQLRSVLAVNASSAQMQAVLAPDASRINGDDWLSALNVPRSTTFFERAQSANVLANAAFSSTGWSASVRSSSIAERRMAWSTMVSAGQLLLEGAPNTVGMGVAYTPQALRVTSSFGQTVLERAASYRAPLAGSMRAQRGSTTLDLLTLGVLRDEVATTGNSAVGRAGGTNSAHSAYQYELLKRDLLRQEIANPGESMSGPVVFRVPVAGATPVQVQQIRQYTDIGNLSIDEGYMSPTGRVSTTGALRNAASYAADAERTAAEAAGRPYTGVVGHGLDTTWTGRPVAPFWLDVDRSINSSLGRQAQNYPLGYKPTRFIYEGDLNWTGNGNW